MRKLRVILSLAMIVALVLSFTVSTRAADAGKVIFETDFSADTLDESMWYVSGGTVELTDEYGERFLRCTSIVGGARQVEINFGPEEVENIDVTMRIRARETRSETNAAMGLHFRSTTIPASRNFAYQLGLSELNMSLNVMNNWYDTQTTPLADDFNVKVRAGLWNNLKLCLREDRIVVFVNGEMVCDIKDSTYPNEGSIGISGVRYTFDVDDIVMTQYSGSNLPEPTPNEAPIWVGELGTDEKQEIADTGQERVKLPGKGDGDEIFAEGVNLNLIISISLLALAAILLAGSVIIGIMLVKKPRKEAEGL